MHRKGNEPIYDYMRALHDKFYTEQDISNLSVEIRELHRKLVSELGKEQRRDLLLLIDKEDERCHKTSLHSFVAGFRTAAELVRELSLSEPYSFDKDEERRTKAINLKGSDKDE